MAVETVRGYGRQNRHHLRTLLPAVWHYQSVARNSYGTLSAVLKSLERRIISASCQDRWPVRWIWMHFSMPWVRPGLPVSCGLELWACARVKWHVLHLCCESSKTRMLKLYISGPAGHPAKLSSRKSSTSMLPFPSPVDGLFDFSPTCEDLSFFRRHLVKV
jgi:hypothetical protein